MNKMNLKEKKGYTVLETVIAVAIFLVVVTIGMGALLNANLVHQKSQDMRSLTDSLSFIMDDMSKNLRIGSVYHCINDGNLSATEPRSCGNGAGISFKSFDGTQLKYVVDSTISSVQKYVGAEPAVSLTPPQVVVDSISGFTVQGAESDLLQPMVTIRLVGKITYKNIETPFSLQTSVSERLIDVP